MADNSYFLPDDPPATTDAHEQLATAQQWASMTFAGVSIDPGTFGPRWDQARGAVARTTVALLRFDDQALTRHFVGEADPLRRVMEIHQGLRQEIDYLKTHLEALEMAATRLLCVASRYAEESR
jgi:hypothetical protein